MSPPEGSPKRGRKRMAFEWKNYLPNLRGNLSLWSLGLSVFIFKAWQWYFEYPAETEVAVLGGFLYLKVSHLVSVITFVLGWLVGIYSLKNLQKVMASFFRPINLVTDSETKDFFAAPATMLFSFALLLFVIDTTTANIAFKIASRYEIFVSLPKGSGTFLILPDNKLAERTSLKPGQVVRIALRGRSDSQVLLLRDQYNLVTLDALNFIRSGFRSIIVEVPTIAGAGIVKLSDNPGRGRKGIGLFAIVFTGPLRYGSTKVAVTITPLGRGIKRGGWVQPGSGSDCPERAGPAYARKFFQALCDNRNLFSVWDTIPAYEESSGGEPRTVVYHSIGLYDVTVLFEKSQVKIAGDWFETREAKEFLATEKDVELK